MTDGNPDRIIGGYATAFASLIESPPSLSSHMRISRFGLLVEERLRGFVGREYVFEAVDRALKDGQFASGYVVIRGEPGIGKTALAAGLAVRNAWVHHFNIAPENIRSRRLFLENVCAQLIARYGLPHAALPAETSTAGEFLMRLLHEAVDVASERDDLPVVVIVDALDEAEEPEPGANRLLLPRTLPKGVFFVVTTRDKEDDRLDVDHGIEIWINEDDPANQRDVKHYIERFIAEHADAMHLRIAEWDRADEMFVADIATLSEGNFMYLVHVLPEIATGRLGRDAVGGIMELPRGLNGYYRRHWRDMKDADVDRFETLQRPVLCFLAISREPVSLMELSQWADIEPGRVATVIAEWHEFLNEDRTEPPLYRIYHRSFAEFLDGVENLRWYHNRIAEKAIEKIPGFLGE